MAEREPQGVSRRSFLKGLVAAVVAPAAVAKAAEPAFVRFRGVPVRPVQFGFALPNTNGRIYPRAVWEKDFAEYAADRAIVDEHQDLDDLPLVIRHLDRAPSRFVYRLDAVDVPGAGRGLRFSHLGKQ